MVKFAVRVEPDAWLIDKLVPPAYISGSNQLKT